MGVSYYLACRKCQHVVEALWELDTEAAEDAADLIDWYIKLDKIGNPNITYDELRTFIDKHKDHGGFELVFN